MNVLRRYLYKVLRETFSNHNENMNSTVMNTTLAMNTTMREDSVGNMTVWVDEISSGDLIKLHISLVIKVRFRMLYFVLVVGIRLFDVFFC